MKTLRALMSKFCLLLSVFCLNFLQAQEEVHLAVPNLKRENIIGTNVGIRPCRKTGVRIEAEMLGEKLVIHNYGYGGSGLTLSLGGAKEVTDLLNHKEGTVAVLGGGVIGLATAYDLLQMGYEVHIYADAWENLTSHVAAGIWSPMVLPDDVSQVKKKRIERMLATSHERFASHEFAGIRWVDSYSFRTGTSEGAIKTKGLGEPVIAHFDNGITKTGKKIREIAIDGNLFMQDLKEKVTNKGALFHTHHFHNKEELLQLDQPIIINCTSIGSRELFNDKEFIPVRGQMIYFAPQENIDYVLYQNVPEGKGIWVSIYAWHDRVILGGIYEKGEETRETVPETLNMLLNNAEKCFNNTL